MAAQSTSSAASKSSDDLSTLRVTIDSTLALLSTFQLSLTSTTSPAPDIVNPPNPLRLLSDACSLLKAQTTKLSLLILNKPFTPTAITFILKNLSTDCLPALMTALELCSSQQYTKFLKDHVRANLSRIMREMTTLLGTIPTNEAALAGSTGSGKEEGGRDTLPSTGVIWEVCDAMTSLASDGLAELAAKKADAYHALIKDAIAELEEWIPDGEEDDPFGIESSNGSEEDENVTDEDASLTPPTTALNTLTLTPPTTPTPIRQMYEQALVILRLIRLLYPALRKRRIQNFPPITSSTPQDQLPTPWEIQTFDNLMKFLRTFSEAADELAGALYNQDEEAASGGLVAIKMNACECLGGVNLSWHRKEDEFTAWVKKWKERLNEQSPGPVCDVS